MATYNMHSIKSQARKEACDSWSPFRKNMSKRSSTWPGDTSALDIESANGPTKSRGIGNLAECEMTAAVTSNSNGKPNEADSEGTTVDRISMRPGRFSKKGRNKQVDDHKPKKRPWYKGKELHHAEPFTIRNQIQRTIFNSWINVLLIAAPVGIALNCSGVNKKAVFVANFIAIIPLAGMLGFATEEIALHVGESLGGLLNASFGNAVEMIVAIIALAKDEVIVVQTSLIGSILSNLLLVLGMCFFFGGLRRKQQFFNETVAQTAASLLALAVGSVIIPTCFDKFSVAPATSVAALSRGTAVILLVVYGGYLYFQLHTHSDMFNETSQKVAMKPRKHALPEGALAKGIAKAGGIGAGVGRPNVENRPLNDELFHATALEEDGEEPEEPTLHIAVAWATLAGTTAIIGLCGEFMVDSISAITDTGGISVEFVGLILLPIVGNAAEHATAVTVAVKDKMDLAIGVAIGSSMQVSLFLIPLLVVIGWIMGKEDMTLSFDGFQVAVMFVAILLVNYLIGDGKSNWLEGQLLMCLYLVIAVCAWYYPQIDSVTGRKE